MSSNVVETLYWNSSPPLKTLLNRINSGEHINSADDQGRTALLLAAEEGNGPLVLRLIQLGADVTAIDKLGRTGLHVAARSGCVEAIDALLIAAASRRGSSFGNTAAGGGSSSLTASLLSFSLTSSQLSTSSSSPSPPSSSTTASTMATTTSLSSKPQMDAGSPGSGTPRSRPSSPLSSRSRSSSTSDASPPSSSPNPSLSSLLSSAFSIGASGSSSLVPPSPLASRNSSWLIFLEVRDRNQETALHHAAGCDQRQAVLHLILRGADIHALNHEGLTPLRYLSSQFIEDGVVPMLIDRCIRPLDCSADFVEKLNPMVYHTDILGLRECYIGPSLPSRLLSKISSGFLKGLYHLDLSSNHLSRIPTEICNSKLLPSIRVLILDRNELRAIPPEISRLKSLERLSLRRNRLVAIPVRKFRKMVYRHNLTALDVGENPIEIISPDILEGHAAQSNIHPGSAQQLVKQLTTMSKWNHLKLLVLGPADDGSKSQVLQALKAPRDSGVSSIPFLGSLFRALSSPSGSSLSSSTSSAGGTPTPPIERSSTPGGVGEDDHSSSAYDLQINVEEWQAVPPEKKLKFGTSEEVQTLLGTGPLPRRSALPIVHFASGASLSSSLLPSSPTASPHNSSTSLSSLTVSLSPTMPSVDVNDETASDMIQYKAFQCSGNDQIHLVNFLMTIYSLVFLVFDIADIAGPQIEYWLKTVTARTGGRAPVILVGIWSDDKPCTDQYLETIRASLLAKYQSEFPNIVHAATLNRTSGVGGKLLQRNTHVVASAYLGTQRWITRSVTDLVLLLRNRRSNGAISWQDFAQLAEAAGVKSSEVHRVAQYLHESAVIFHQSFGEESLDETVVLDARSVFKAINNLSRLKPDESTGGVDKDTLLAIWDSVSCQRWLLGLLEKFEVCLKQERLFILPTLLPDFRPSNFASVWPVNQLGSSTTGLASSSSSTSLSSSRSDGTTVDDCNTCGRIYLFKFLPSGFFGHLFVRISKMVTELQLLCYWRYGLVAELQGEKCFILYNKSSYRLQVRVRGRPGSGRGGEKRHRGGILLSHIVKAIETLIGASSSLVEREVFVICSHCISAGELSPFQFPLTDVANAVMKGDRFLYCRGLRSRPVRIDYLVPDYFLTLLTPRFHIPFTDLRFIKEIGEGSFAVVYEGFWDQEIVAIKKLKSLVFDDEGPLDDDEHISLDRFLDFQQECWIMSGLDHPNLLKMKGICTKPMCLITEFVPEGPLHELLSDTNCWLSWKFRLRIALDVAKGMRQLHSMSPPIVHCDLKSPNILLCTLSVPEGPDSVVAKVADFGLARVQARSYSFRDALNPYWTAVEVIKGEDYTREADVFSFGITLWELLSRQIPYSDQPEYKFWKSLELRIINGLRPTIPALATVTDLEDDWQPTTAFISLIAQCWDQNPKKRPRFEDLVVLLMELCGYSPEEGKVDSGNNTVEKHSSVFFKNEDLGIYDLEDEDEDDENLLNRRHPLNSNLLSLHQAEPEPTEAIALQGIVSLQTMANLPQGSIRCMAPVNGMVWASFGEKYVAVFSQDGELVTCITLRKDPVYAMHVIGDTVWTGSLGEINIWDSKEFALISTLKGHDKQGWIKSFVMTSKDPQTKILSACTEGMLICWDVRTYKQLSKVKLGFPITCMSWGPDNQLFVGSDRIIYRLNSDFKIVKKWPAHGAVINAIVHTGEELWSCGDNAIKIWDNEGKEKATLDAHTGKVLCLKMVRNYVLSGSFDKSILVWDAKTHDFVQELKGHHTDAIRSLCEVEGGVWSGSSEFDGNICRWVFLPTETYEPH